MNSNKSFPSCYNVAIPYEINEASDKSWSKSWHGYVLVTEEGDYTFYCTADDDGSVTIAGVTSMTTGPHSATDSTPATVHLTPRYHACDMSYANTQPEHAVFSATFDGNPLVLWKYDHTPRLAISPDVLCAGKSTTAEVVCPLPDASYRIEASTEGSDLVTYETGLGTSWEITAKDAVTLSGLLKSSNEKGTVTFTLYDSAGAVLDSQSIEVIQETHDVPPTCQCGCDYKSNPGSGSVSFRQKFGASPWAYGDFNGFLTIHEEFPAAHLFTPACLDYEHPMLRRIVSNKDDLNVIIRANGRTALQYTDGKPQWNGASLNCSLSSHNGIWMETLEDRTKVFYDSDGNVSKLASPEGNEINVTALGIEIIRDTDNAIRQIYSVCDGLMNVVTVDSTHYRLEWYKTADVGEKVDDLYTTGTATPIKTFTFGKVVDTTDNKHFELIERRGATFEFHYRWDYVDANAEWTYTRGTGTEAITETKTLETVSDVYTKQSTISQTGATSIVKTETVSGGDYGNALTGEVVDGKSRFSRTRVTEGNGIGKVATETDFYGNTTSYTYDELGRVLSETRTGFAGFSEKTEYSYSTPHDSWGGIEYRPAVIRHLINDVEFSRDEYEYSDMPSNHYVIHNEIVGGVTQTSRTQYYRPDQMQYRSGRLYRVTRPDGTMTHYDRSNTSLATTPAKTTIFTETIIEGIAGTGNTFTNVPYKSTRTINTYDMSGNKIRSQHFVHTGSGFSNLGTDNFTYTPTHKIATATYANKKTYSADWICTGPTTETDADGIVTNYTYDSMKRCIGKTRLSPNGTITESYTLDLEGNIIQTVITGGELSKNTSKTFDSLGRITSSTDEAGLVTTWSYSADNLTTTETRPGGGTVITTLNADKTVASITGTAVTPEYYTYSFDDTNALKVMTVHYGSIDSDRWTATYENGFGQVVKVEESAFDGAVRTTVNTYNAKGQLVSTAVTGEPTVTYEYDVMGNRTAQTLSDGMTTRTTSAETTYEIDSSNIVWRVTTTRDFCSDEDIEPVVTVKKERLSGLTKTAESTNISIDARGNTSITTSVFSTSDKTHTLTTVNPAISNAASQIIKDGLTLSQTDFAGVATTFGYDTLHRQVTQTDGRGNTTTQTYNNKGQIVSVTDAANHTTSYAYFSASGLLQTVTDANNKSISYTYDVKGQKLTESGDATYPVDYVYNTFGELIQHKTCRTTATPDVTTWDYDESSGLLSSKTYADNKSVTYTYNAAGRLMTRTWARTLGTEEAPLITTYSYNVYGDLTGVAYSDNVTPSVINTYDAMGRLVSTTDASGVNSKTYTDYSELASEANNVLGTSFAITYDAYGREASSAMTKGESSLATFGQAYNAGTGRFASASFGSNVFAYSYLANSNLISGMTTANGTAEKVFTYETSRDLPTEIKYQTTGETPELIAKRNYTFDALGRVSARTQTRGSDPARNDVFGYNHRSELTSASIGTNEYAYSFDNIGNRITAEELTDEIAYEANNLNQYTSIEKNSGTPFEPTFDDDGNQLTVQTATGVWTVAYNAENRPVTFTNGTTVIECKFDSQGRRFEKKVTADGTVTFRQRYAYKGYLQIAAFNVTLDETDEEVYSLATTTAWDPMEPTATRPLAFTDHTVATPATYFYTHDLTKNVCELLSSSGAIVTAYDYTPFGAVTASNASTPNTFMFSSEVLDPEMALVYYNYRHYNPADGRWISRDQIGEEGALCLYALNRNNVLSSIDNYGLKSTSFWGRGGKVDNLMTGLLGTDRVADGIVAVASESDHTIPPPPSRKYLPFPLSPSTGGTITFLLTFHEIIILENSCKYYCFGSAPCDLIGFSGNVGLSINSGDYGIESPISVSFGVSKNLSIATSSLSDVNINAGFGLAVAPIQVSVRLACISLSDKTDKGCPCGLYEPSSVTKFLLKL